MTGRIVLHIGAMKTGTSFVQSVLGNNQEMLAERGAIFLGSSFGVQSRAVRDVLNLPKQPGRNKRKWRSLVQPVARMEAGQTAVVSMEFLSFASDRHMGPFLNPLRNSGARIEVILTVRDQSRVIPAQWQTYTRNFGDEPWPDYLRRIEPSRSRRVTRSRAHRTFHRAQDITPMLERWSTAHGIATTHIVTVPPPDAPREELWDRFCAAAGFDGSGVDLDDVHDNTSLGFGSCDFLRRVNSHLADVPPRTYRVGMRALARDVLAPLRAEESRPALDRRAAEYAATLNQQLREAMSDSRFELYGRLDDLPVPTTFSDQPRKAASVPDDEVRRATTAVLDHLESAAGVDVGPRASKLDDLVAQAAQGLRRANDWDA
ncbi:hypothetical protein [Nocardioides jensenii]|uniref:hypothetical protein n=1 Tax=Nocardioides jensenii TaxID=1843 RepID=UPI00082BF130|nr:hypothetical protein [Nocardioides jensenii]